MTTRKRPRKKMKTKTSKSTTRTAKKSTATRMKASAVAYKLRTPTYVHDRSGATSRAQDVVTMPREEFEELLARLENLEDTREIQAAETRGVTPDALPDSLVERLLAGEHPVRIWRDHRGLTLAQLAERANVGTSYISEIETSKKPGSAQTLKALARALQVDLDDLVP